MVSSDLRPLVSIEQHNIALLFCDYLHTLEVAAQVESEDNGFVIYCSQDNYDLALAEFKQFIEQPYDAKYQQAAWDNGRVTEVSAHSPALLSSFKEQFFAHAGLATITIFILCWIVFIASQLGWSRVIFDQLQFYPQLNF